MNVQMMQAIATLAQQRADLLAQLTTTAQAARLTTEKWAALQVAVSAEGEIGSVWPDAAAANQQLIDGLGGAVPRTLAALEEMIAAARALQTAGEAMGLDLLPGLPRT
jgi:hypothetical protein